MRKGGSRIKMSKVSLLRSQRIVYGAPVKMHRSASPISARPFFQECPFRARIKSANLSDGYIMHTKRGCICSRFASYVCARNRVRRDVAGYRYMG